MLDQYYLTKEDWDNLVDLGIGTHNKSIMSKISSATKSYFTRTYVKAKLIF